MTTRAVIPIKAPAEAKLRLAGTLAPQARAALVAAMLAVVVRAARAARGLDEVMLIGPHDYAGLGDTPPLRIEEPDRTEPDGTKPDGGEPEAALNAALMQTLAQATADGIERLVILPGDLPQLTPRDVELLLTAVPADEIRLAPDRHGIGTNALSLPLPAAADFHFAFGEDSCARHRGEAERLGLDLSEVYSPGLERDIDLPADLDDASGLMHEIPGGEMYGHG